MWQDRRPNASSPSRSSTNSPLPARRPTNSGPVPIRPNSTINPRSSSLSLLSTPASSATNLAAGLRAAHGSTLRHELRTETPPISADPVKALEDILGSPISRRDSLDNPIIEEPSLPDGLEDPIDFQGLSLEDFAVQTSASDVISSVITTSIGSEKCMFD
jgi:hypothetical protein